MGNLFEQSKQINLNKAKEANLADVIAKAEFKLFGKPIDEAKSEPVVVVDDEVDKPAPTLPTPPKSIPETLITKPLSSPNNPEPLIIPAASPAPITSRKDIILNTKQNLAISTCLENQFANIIGYAGSGKTTVVMRLIEKLIEFRVVYTYTEWQQEVGEAYNDNNPDPKHSTNIEVKPPQHLNLNHNSLNFAMIAFTGLATKTLKKSVPNSFKDHCYTIHKLLDVAPVDREVMPSKKDVKEKNLDPNIPIVKTFFEPRRDKYNKLPFKLIVIDEFSMVGAKLWQWLYDALPYDCRIITIGDLAQIPPVLDVAVQPIVLQKWPTVELTEVYRQKDGDMIDNANAIRQLKQPKIGPNFKLMKLDRDVKLAQRQALAFIKKSYENGSYDPNQDILITPMNTTEIGQEMLNVLTRPIVNAENKDSLTLIKTMRNHKSLAVGDRVMNIKNDNEAALFNGMLGWIKEININSGMASHHVTLGTEMGEFTFNSDALVQELADKQKRQRARDKARRIFGESLDEVLTKDDEDKEEGTGIRKASHVLTTQFDYEEEDDPSGLNSKHYLETSSQIENLIPAWWITIHKSQGSGFRNVFILLHNYASQMLCNELLYTAVTRCTDNVTILTTNYAWKKALTTQRIEGDNLQDKIDNFCNLFDFEKYKDLKIPDSRKINVFYK